MTRQIAVCFFGITRSLKHTLPSIKKNILTPARTLGHVKIYSHFFQQAEIHNPRTQEKGSLDQLEYKLLNSDWLELEPPELCLDAMEFERLKAWGDVWDTNFISLRNLAHQLHSLNQVTLAALADNADICIFCRPDLKYHESLNRPLRAALRSGRNVCYLPRWQAWEGGLNDRFAICAGREAIVAYGQRGKLAAQFCCERNAALHSESLVKYALTDHKILVRGISAKASRVRFDGTQVEEDFTHPIKIKLWPFIRTIRRSAGWISDALGVKRKLKKMFRVK